MIIFDYATLADDSHRRHFIEPHKDHLTFEYDEIDAHGIALPGTEDQGKWYYDNAPFEEWKSDYAAYYAAAKDDRPISQVIQLMRSQSEPYDIWCDFPEAYRNVITDWFSKIAPIWEICDFKLRPDGDTTPWHELKERWYLELDQETKWGRRNPTNLAFETSGSPMIEVWKKYGVICLEVHNG